MKVFGDDGFRDVFGKGLLSKNFLANFFLKLSIFFERFKIKKVVIGYDTRGSHKNIIIILLNNLVYYCDIEVLDKPVPTPCLAYLSKKNKNTFFIMITASHFNKRFNGFKFFFKGKKLIKKYEKDILKSKIIKEKNIKVNKIKYTKDYFYYENYLNNNFKSIRLNKKILIDFSYGAASSMMKTIKFFKQVKKIKYSFNYNNINLKCGSNFLKQNIKKKEYNKYDYVFAFDGDADRVSIYKKGYGIIESEKICIIFAEFLKSKSVIGTQISSPDIKKYFKDKKIKYFQAQVGDRNVTDLQKKFFSKIGFETSGHYSFNNYMDGIFATGFFLKILKNNNDLIEKILNISFEYELYKFNLDKDKIYSLKKLNLKKYKFLKVIKRKSIWSDIFRVYIFFLKKEKKSFLHLIHQLKKLSK
jgi:phosphoglucosamine mutase